MPKQWIKVVFAGLVYLCLLSPLFVFKDYLFPFVTSKAFTLRIFIELALPFYVYLLASDASLRPKLKNPLTISLLVFLAINLITALFGVNVLRSLWGNFERMGGVFYLAHLVLLYFYVLALAQMKGSYLLRFLYALIGIAVISSLNGISGKLGGPVFVQDPSLPYRASSTFGNPIFFASFLILPAFLTIFFALEEEAGKVWKKVMWWALALVQFIGIFQSGTRGATVGLVLALLVSAVVYVFISKHDRVRLYGAYATVAIVVAVGLLFAFQNSLPNGTTLKRLTQLRDNNSQSRLLQWGIAWEGYKDRPVLGTGPENYYVISNQHYNPELYKYDPSWFDKPHNYLLEILVTNGVFGLLAYLSVIGFGLWGLWRAFRSEFITPLEFCVLLCGMLVYQIQNIFVFDTVSASIAFFIYLGFMGYLWWAAESSAEARQNLPGRKGTGGPRPVYGTSSWPLAWGGITAAAVLYMLYVGNYMGMSAARAVNYGYAYSSVDAKKALGYFESATTQPFNFDPAETGNKFADMAFSMAQSAPQNTSQDTVREIIEKAVAYQERTAERIGNDPVVYQRLGHAYLAEAVVNRSNDFSKAKHAITKSTELAPKRVEAKQALVQVYISEGRAQDAERLISDILSVVPERSELRWQMALLYYYTNRQQQAVAIGEQMLRDGYRPGNAAQLQWLISHYEEQGNHGRSIALLDMATKMEPQNVELYVQLAHAYAKAGNKQAATQLAQNIAKADPTKKAAMDALLQTLK